MIAGGCRRPAPAAALVAAIALGTPAASALGRPEWAEPYLSLPRPSGPYIAANDAWVIVYGEMTYSLRGKWQITQSCRLILENVAAGPETLTTTVAYDEGRQDLVDISLHVQRRLWHEINLNRKAVAASVAGSSQEVLASAEQIEPGRRAVLQYTIADRLGFNPWVATLLPREEPIARLQLAVAPSAAAQGLVLELVTPRGVDPPPGFEREGPQVWRVEHVPARARIGTLALSFQPEESELFPYFLASLAGSPGESLVGYGAHYRKAWVERAAGFEKTRVKEQADALVRDLGSWRERVGAVSRFVQRDIQYDDSNERSIEGWLPLSTQETLRSRKADCKGKVMILQALLEAIGVESVPLLLRSDPRYFSWNGRPGGAFLNHVILAVRPPTGESEVAGTLVDGPLAGWVLIDPTVQTTRFGSPMPGLEGVPALAIGNEPEVITLRTRVASTLRVQANVDWRLDPVGGAEVRAHLSDNGGSPFVSRLRNTAVDERARVVGELVATRLAGVTVTACALTDPWHSASGVYELDVDLRVANATHRLASAMLAEGPMALAAQLAGVPNGLPAAARRKPEDVVTLAPPWDAKRNATGTPMEVIADVTLQLPPGVVWMPPPARSEHRPWLTFDQSWQASGPSRWSGSLRIELARGSWDDAQRRERLALTDEVFTALYAPQVLAGE